MQMLMWSCGIALSTFYSTCPLFSLSTSVCICLCLHLCITVIYLSISLEVTGSVFLFVLFSFNFSFDSSFLLEPLHFPNLFPISWILFSTISPPSTWRKIGRATYTLFYIWQAVWPQPIHKPLAFQIAPLSKRIRVPFYLLPWGSMRRIVWDGNSNANGCHCWDFLFIRYLISITSLIPKIFYLEGLYCYIPPFYQRGDWDTTWSYGLSKIAEKNLYSNLCLCHGICIKFW